jgi:hypothetical protein
MSGLTNKTTRNGNRKLYYCSYCLSSYKKKDKFELHEKLCQEDLQLCSMPKKDFIEFTNYERQTPLDFVIYSDFESLLIPITSKDDNDKIDKINKHIPISFSCFRVSQNGYHTTAPVVYTGTNCIDMFFKHLENEYNEIQLIYNTQSFDISWTKKSKLLFKKSTKCNLCKTLFIKGTNIKNADHDSLKPKDNFRQALCTKCNIHCAIKPNKLPVIMHGFQNYDSHLIVNKFEEFLPKKCKISGISKNSERFLTLSINNIKFIDSFAFLNTSLFNLTENLRKKGDPHNNFNHLFKYLDHPEMALRKGVYPYKYMDRVTRLDEQELPSKLHFFDDLNNKPINETDYKYANKIWKKYNCKTLKDYTELYCKQDTLLLACIFESFRKQNLKFYKLDPVYYLSSPALALDCALKKTKIKLELLKDQEMYLFFEKGIRGGTSYIGQRYAKANNPDLSTYDFFKDISSIINLDANSLYAGAMKEPMPYGGFKWLTSQETDTFNIENIPDDNPEGYVLMVDLKYPKELHDLHDDYPLAVEQLNIPSEDLSPLSKKILKTDNLYRSKKSKKLIPNLFDKKNYIAHYRILKIYIKYGLKITKIHKILQFKQKRWLESYVDFNIEQRKKAQNDFEKDYWKLLNNSVFGNFLESIRKRKEYKFVIDPVKLEKLTGKPTFRSSRILYRDLVLIEMQKCPLILDKPIYVGFSILDISKILLYDFHYSFIIPKFGKNASLLFTDTDSLCYWIKHDDPFKIFKQYEEKYFDFSNYPNSHPIFSNINKGKPGFFKNVCPFPPIQKFVGLKSKMYAIKQDGNQIKKIAKGIKKSVINEIDFEQYFHALIDKTKTTHNYFSIRSFKHQLYTINQKKIGLSCFDDKRYILNNNIQTRAHGNYINGYKTNKS